MPKIYIAAIMGCILGLLFVFQNLNSFTQEFGRINENLTYMERRLNDLQSFLRNLEDKVLERESAVERVYFGDHFYCSFRKGEEDHIVDVTRIVEGGKMHSWYLYSDTLADFDPDRPDDKGLYELIGHRIVIDFGEVEENKYYVKSLAPSGEIISFGHEGAVSHREKCPKEIQAHSP